MTTPEETRERIKKMRDRIFKETDEVSLENDTGGKWKMYSVCIIIYVFNIHIMLYDTRNDIRIICVWEIVP